MINEFIFCQILLCLQYRVGKHTHSQMHCTLLNCSQVSLAKCTRQIWSEMWNRLKLPSRQFDDTLLRRRHRTSWERWTSWQIWCIPTSSVCTALWMKVSPLQGGFNSLTAQLVKSSFLPSSHMVRYIASIAATWMWLVLSTSNRTPVLLPLPHFYMRGTMLFILSHKLEGWGLGMRPTSLSHFRSWCLSSLDGAGVPAIWWSEALPQCKLMWQQYCCCCDCLVL